GGEERLQDVVGKRQRDHGLVGRVDHKHGDPQTQEPETERRDDGTVTNTEAWEKQQGVRSADRWGETGGNTWHIYILPFTDSHSK
ncbi:hypothetical protein DVA81_19170, partial [Acinetobacter baumannii]